MDTSVPVPSAGQVSIHEAVSGPAPSPHLRAGVQPPLFAQGSEGWRERGGWSQREMVWNKEQDLESHGVSMTSSCHSRNRTPGQSVTT